MHSYLMLMQVINLHALAHISYCFPGKITKNLSPGVVLKKSGIAKTYHNLSLYSWECGKEENAAEN